MILALEAVALGLVIGAVLGGLGGGGAILTVPALVYVLGRSATEATTGSLVIVGLTAAVGAAAHVRSSHVDWRTGLLFGTLGLPATWLGSLLNRRVDPDLLLLGFAALMLVAATAMLHGQRSALDPQREVAPVAVGAGGPPTRPRPSASAPHRVEDPPTGPRRPWIATVVAALGVGLLTGFFGVGGGFVVVPALVVALGLPMPLAVGTSLLVVALNSATSLLARAGDLQIDLSVVAPFTLAAMVATFAGKRVADHVPSDRLRGAFAALLLLVAGYTAWQSIGGLTTGPPSSEPAAASTSAAPHAPVDAGVARRAIQDGAVVIDVRTPEEYRDGHVAGAVNLDLSSAGFAAAVDTLDPAARYVVYCASGRRAAEAITLMDRADIGRAVVNGGGLEDLVAAGVPTRSDIRPDRTDPDRPPPEETP